MTSTTVIRKSILNDYMNVLDHKIKYLRNIIKYMEDTTLIKPDYKG